MSRIRGIEARLLKLQNNEQQDLDGGNKKYDENKEKNVETFDYKLDVENEQMQELLHKLPKLGKIFDVHKKIGEGTFSTVYLGSLKMDAALPEEHKRWFAIKHLVPTAHPARIEHELRCLQDMGGKHNVIGVELCLRNLDTIVFVMPYIPHRKFSEYVGDMDAEEVRQYMTALLVALRHVHSFGVIHRDIKPSNFLYDRENRRYLLVDFGLAQRTTSEPPPADAPRKRARDEDEPAHDAKRMALDLSLRARGVDTVAPVVPRRTILPKVQIPKQNIPKPGVASRRCQSAVVRRARRASGRRAPRAARRHAGLPPARGAAEEPAPGHARGHVGGGRGAGQPADGALPLFPRRRRRVRAGRAGRPAGHRAAAPHRARARASHRDVVAAPRALPAQTGCAPALARARLRARRRARLRALPRARAPVPVQGRHSPGGRNRQLSEYSRFS
ncbi:uncharacterized protein LOC112049179 isoform X3 [Bicyclus anynana]|uniref:non-specific serine/threonine protein kinase n=1 Tax=Bicyclus anynana TaxID=110368 RepID=A0ABM3LDZ2_BICAN|nr:uncharacterized protein LOC112049179 isoform X3 [Bicyclus anynana]